MEDTTFHSSTTPPGLQSSASVVENENVNKAEKRQTAEENMSDSDNKHVRDLRDKQVFCDREIEKIPNLVENGDSVQHAKQENMACVMLWTLKTTQYSSMNPKNPSIGCHYDKSRASGNSLMMCLSRWILELLKVKKRVW